MYIDIIDELHEKNKTKARALDISYYFTVGGLTISFIAILGSMIQMSEEKNDNEEQSKPKKKLLRIRETLDQRFYKWLNFKLKSL